MRECWVEFKPDGRCKVYSGPGEDRVHMREVIKYKVYVVRDHMKKPGYYTLLVGGDGVAYFPSKEEANDYASKTYPGLEYEIYYCEPDEKDSV